MSDETVRRVEQLEDEVEKLKGRIALLEKTSEKAAELLLKLEEERKWSLFG